MSDIKRGRARERGSDTKAQRAPTVVDQPVPLKLALLLPAKADLRMLRRAAELAAALVEAQAGRGELLEVAVGLAEPDDRRWRRGEALIRQRAPTAVVRHLAWTAVPVGNARRMFADLDPALDLEGIEEVMVPRDWGWNFQDCALWLCFAEPATGPILPLRPIVYYSLGLPERYVPEMVADTIHDAYWTRQVEAFRLWRQATVVTSDPTAVVDLVSYAGVRNERIEVIPDVMGSVPSLTPVDAELRDREVLVWVTRGSAVDDLGTCLAGLQTYFREGGGLDVMVAEEAAGGAHEHPDVASLPDDLRALYATLERVKYRSLEELDRLLVRSGALWSSQIAGGGGEHLLEAERAGLPVLAASFPLIRQMVEERALAARLYDPGDALGIADALKEIEEMARGPAPLADAAMADARQGEAFAFLLDWLQALSRAR